MLLILLSGCCPGPEPDWEVLSPVNLAQGSPQSLDLAEFLNEVEEAEFSVEAGEGIKAGLEGSQLTLQAEPGFEGTSEVKLTATVACERKATATLVVSVAPVLCPATFAYTPRAGGVPYVAGEFNSWSLEPMEPQESGYVLQLSLPPGPWAYKFIEEVDGQQLWSCDPENDRFLCDADYSWDASCPVGGAGCNSLLQVPDCTLSSLSLSSLNIDKTTASIQVEVLAQGDIQEPWATLDGVAIESWTGEGFSFSKTGLSAGRHSLWFGGTSPDGRDIKPIYVPFWLDEGSWEQGLLYFVFVDRFFDGDSSNNEPFGATAVGGDYAGGDWAGVIEKLDYLESLGVTALWLTAPLDNAEGPWGADCGTTVTGYHGYWPDSFELEEHFGTEEELRALIEAAHQRQLRVLVDFVANHTHQDHPWVSEHPDWFNPEFICKEDEDNNGVLNWDQRPESCWFASYLPDLDYSQKDALVESVEQAVELAKSLEIDGFRVDAVKHMPTSLHADLSAAVEAEIEHRAVGGTEDFYLVGETFSGDRGLIASYTGEGLLDGQFDFPLYWAIVAAFARDEIGLSNGDGSLLSVAQDSSAAFEGRLMSTFLGNHDVWRFIAQANGEVSSLYGDGNCNPDNSPRSPDTSPESSLPYQRLMLAWTFLLSWPGLPLIYYGDEIGLPGYGDPDNRQQMRWSLSSSEAMVLEHVQKLGVARREHPALSGGTTTVWWEGEAELLAYARTNGEDAVLVLLNRSSNSQTLSNSLAFAGLSSGTYRDILSDEEVTSSGDNLSIEIPAYGSRVLIFSH
jgi:glycosidase